MTDFRKREFLLYYGLAYLIIAIFETFLFTAIIGKWTLYDFFLNFSIWGIIWLVSLFAYPMFFTDAMTENLALDPLYALLGFYIIIAGLFLTYQLHIKIVEKRIGKELSFNKLMNLYFPIKEEIKK